MKPKTLDIRNVTIRFSGLEKPVLSQINYTVLQQDFVIILGSNGSGKSSLLKAIDRRYAVSSGEIYVENKPIHQYPEKDYSRLVKTLTQDPHETLFTTLTVLENYLLVKHPYERRLLKIHNKAERKFLAQYLKSFNPNLPHKLDQLISRLSGGEKQALALALTVLFPPSILLLDEHTSALDPKAAEDIMRLTQNVIENHQMTCLLATHDLSIAENYGNRVLSLKNGQIFTTIERQEKKFLNKDQILTECY